MLLGFFLFVLVIVIYFLIIAIDHPPKVTDFSGLKTKRIRMVSIPIFWETIGYGKVKVVYGKLISKENPLSVVWHLDG